MQTEEIALPSGAKLSIQLAPFAVAKNLFQALLKEMKGLEISTKGELEVLALKAFALGYSSPTVELALWACLERCRYNGAKIDKDTFEPVLARGDYIKVCAEVVKSNVGPFMKNLLAELSAGIAMAESALESKEAETQ